MSNDAWILLWLVCAVVIGLLAGIATERQLWRGDCESMNAHLSYGKVYDCKLRLPERP